MGFLKPELPEIDIEEWSKGTRAEKIIPMARHWAEVGFGTPVVLHLFYVVKSLWATPEKCSRFPFPAALDHDVTSWCTVLLGFLRRQPRTF